MFENFLKNDIIDIFYNKLIINEDEIKDFHLSFNNLLFKYYENEIKICFLNILKNENVVSKDILKKFQKLFINIFFKEFLDYLKEKKLNIFLENFKLNTTEEKIKSYIISIQN